MAIDKGKVTVKGWDMRLPWTVREPTGAQCHVEDLGHVEVYVEPGGWAVDINGRRAWSVWKATSERHVLREIDRQIGTWKYINTIRPSGQDGGQGAMMDNDTAAALADELVEALLDKVHDKGYHIPQRPVESLQDVIYWMIRVESIKRSMTIEED